MAQVPATAVESTSLGDVAEFTIPFPFLSRAEVFVTVDGAPVAFTWINDGLVQLAEVPELGAIVRRYRSTEAFVPLHQFSQGVPFLPRYVDRDFKQNLYAVQESVNDTAGTAAQALATAEESLVLVQDAFDILSERTQYIVLGPYGPGLNFQTTSQVFSYLGEFYAPGPSIVLPYTTTGIGAAEIANFRSVGDAILRSDLANTADPAKGAGKVGYVENQGYASGTVGGALNSRVFTASTVIGWVPDGTPNGSTVSFSGRTSPGDSGGGLFTYFTSSTLPVDNGMVFSAGTGKLVRFGRDAYGFVGEVSPEWFGAKGDRATDDSAALNACSNAVLALPNGGVIRLSSGKAYMLSSTWAIPKTVDRPIIIEGSGAVILNSPSFAGILLTFGQPANTGGPPIVIKDVVFRSAAAGTNGVVLTWAGSSELISCRFVGFSNAIYMINTFALIVDKCSFIGCTTAGIQTQTIAHNLKVIASQFSECARDIYFQQPAYNLSVIGCDMESGSSCMQLDMGGSAISVMGCYVEGKTGQSFNFGSAVTGFSMSGTWFGYNSTQSWTNISGGEFKNNIYWDQQQLIGVSCIDLGIASNGYAGTSNKIYPRSAQATLLSGWTNTGAGFASAGYFKSSSGVVQLNGMVTGTADGTAFFLPSGLRPGATMVFPALGASGTTVGRVTIATDGSVAIIRAAGTADLSGISFLSGS